MTSKLKRPSKLDVRGKARGCRSGRALLGTLLSKERPGLKVQCPLQAADCDHHRNNRFLHEFSNVLASEERDLQLY